MSVTRMYDTRMGWVLMSQKLLEGYWVWLNGHSFEGRSKVTRLHSTVTRCSLDDTWRSLDGHSTTLDGHSTDTRRHSTIIDGHSTDTRRHSTDTRRHSTVTRRHSTDTRRSLDGHSTDTRHSALDTRRTLDTRHSTLGGIGGVMVPSIFPIQFYNIFSCSLSNMLDKKLQCRKLAKIPTLPAKPS